jgi:hypothetical protein
MKELEDEIGKYLRKFDVDDPDKITNEIITELENQLSYFIKKGMDRDKLAQEVLEIATDKNVIDSYGCKSPKEPWRYAVIIVKRRHITTETIENVSLIPIGLSMPRRIRGHMTTIIFAIKRVSDKRFEPVRIFCRGILSGLGENVKLLHYYENVRLASVGFNYEARQDTKFDTPKKDLSGGNDLEFFKDKLPRLGITVKRVPFISEVNNFLSAEVQVGDRSRVDNFDLRILRGTVVRPINKATENALIGGYRIYDGSLLEPKVTENGAVVPVDFAIWCHPTFAKYKEESEIFFVGTITVNPVRNEYQMTAIYVIPEFITGVI